MNNNILYTIYTNFFNIEICEYQNGELLLNSKEYTKHLIGIYDTSLKLWYNSWSLLNYNPDEIKLSKDLLKYFVDNDSNNINNNIIKSLIFNSKIYILEKLQLNFIVAVFIYYTKIKKYTIKIKDNLYLFYGLKNNIPL